MRPPVATTTTKLTVPRRVGRPHPRCAASGGTARPASAPHPQRHRHQGGSAGTRPAGQHATTASQSTPQSQQMREIRSQLLDPSFRSLTLPLGKDAAGARVVTTWGQVRLDQLVRWICTLCRTCARASTSRYVKQSWWLTCSAKRRPCALMISPGVPGEPADQRPCVAQLGDVGGDLSSGGHHAIALQTCCAVAGCSARRPKMLGTPEVDRRRAISPQRPCL